MKIIKTGITRTVFLVGRYAIKVPVMRYGLDAWAWGIVSNVSEREWHTFEEWKGKVVPVLHSFLGGLIQVYPRCEPFRSGMTYPEFPSFGPSDKKPENYGVLNGTVVCLDYAVPGERGRSCRSDEATGASRAVLGWAHEPPHNKGATDQNQHQWWRTPGRNRM